MTTTNYINSNGLGLKVTQLPSGAFDLYFSNGFISTCYTKSHGMSRHSRLSGMITSPVSSDRR